MMVGQSAPAEAWVAVLVDCENTSPEILEYALRVVAQFGRVVLRGGYGNHAALAHKWQEALARLAFTSCLQYQYAARTPPISDSRADTFCLVTSDSDFAYLCRELRERGATVHIVGEVKAPDALRNASDQFFEWLPPEPVVEPADLGRTKAAAALAKPPAKRRPKALIRAVELLAGDTPDGWVGLGALGQYLKRNDPGFSPRRLVLQSYWTWCAHILTLR